MAKKPAVVFDLDNTLLYLDDPHDHHKGHHHEFSKASTVAPPNKDMVKKAQKTKEKKKAVVILTARSEHYRPETVKWLDKHEVPYNDLIMREKDDARKDKVVKEELLRSRVLPRYEVSKAYDDRKKNRKMFEKHGIKAKGA